MTGKCKTYGTSFQKVAKKRQLERENMATCTRLTIKKERIMEIMILLK
jgi:hypothetical protein